jgi:isocitrate/isopropylmalate dehydrogenase
MAASYSICVLPGDGIGPEVTDCARRVLDSLAAHDGPSFAYDTQAAGHGTFLEAGNAMPEGALAAAKAADAVLLGAMDVAAIPPGGGLPASPRRPTTSTAWWCARSPRASIRASNIWSATTPPARCV